MNESDKKEPLGKLVILNRQTGNDGREFFITDQKCTIGRKAKNNIRIQIPQVPAEQCQLIMDGTGNATLKNFNYEYPTKVNGNEISSQVLLKHGDRVTIVDRCYRYESSFAVNQDITNADSRNPLGYLTSNNSQKEKKTKHFSHDVVKETPKKKKNKSRRSKAIRENCSEEQQENLSGSLSQFGNQDDKSESKTVLMTKTPSKTGKKKRKSIAVVQETSVDSKEDVFAEATEVVKDNSMMKIKTPNKKKRKSMAVLKEEITVCENVPNKVENCEEEISELLNKTTNIKKKKSIAVVNEKIAISEGNASVEQTEMNDKSVIKSKTPSKTGKKKRKSIAVVQETSVDSKEDVFAEATEVVKDNSMMKIKT